MQRAGGRKRCFQCSEEFETTRSYQLFCSSACRLRHHREESGYCFFCGWFGPEDRHHLEPVAARAAGRFAGQETVPCCKQCNGALGARRWEEIDDQFCHLIEWYEARRGPAKPNWSDEDLSELGASLRRRIRKKVALYRQYDDRIIYLTVRRAQIMQRRGDLSFGAGRPVPAQDAEEEASDVALASCGGLVAD